MVVRDNYLLYMKQTVFGYPTKTKQYLLKMLSNENLVIKDKSLNGQINIDGIEYINIAGMNLDEALLYCIEKEDETIKAIERWEFMKDYKYSVVFTSEDFDSTIEKIDQMSELNTIENEYLFDSLKNPIYFSDRERSYLKFNLCYSAVHPLTREELLLKYPILVVFHKKSKLIELRYDVLKKVFVLDQEKDSYIYMIDTVRGILEQKYECVIKGLDLNYMVSVAKQKEDIKLIAQYMEFNTGQHAQLEVGNNQEYMLPLIGELKTILLDYQEELEKVPVLKDTLEQFMYEKEEMSNYPWIEVLWENEIKTRSIHVKFVFNYMNKDYGLIQHYYSNVLVGMERMNYVVNYIASNRNNITEKAE